ncbi:glycosyl hydrolase family 28-related protein [Nocardia thailandica]
MTTDRLGRRGVLAAALGVAAATPLVACSLGAGTAAAATAAARNVRDFGAVGDGVADDTAAFAAAADAGGRPVVLRIPAGHYRITAWPDLPDFSTVHGDGGDATVVGCEGDGTLIHLRRRQRVRFAQFGLYLTGARATAIRLDECFRCSFEGMVIRGNHLSDNHPRYLAQTGVVLDHNTGGTAFINCDINNFGVGLVTACIQNYVTASKFASNHIGVHGTGNDHNAGLSLTDVEFVSDNDPRTTSRHIDIDGAANNWWLTNIWFEGADTAITVGRRGIGGPAQFGMVNCKVAARSVCLDIEYCRQPYLANVRFDPDTERMPLELRIDAAGCPEGTAINLISSAGEDLPAATFPPAWQVLARTHMPDPQFRGTLVATAGEGRADIARFQSPQGAPVAAVLASGALLSERADGGVVLRDETGAFWRLTVRPDGSVATAALGRDRPQR